MEYPVSHPDLEGLEIRVQGSGLLRAPRLMIDGKTVLPGPKRGQYLVRRKDGAEVTVRLRRTFFPGQTPRLDIGEQTIVLAPPLMWYEWGWSYLPLAVLATGGALGAALGAVAAQVNASLFRSGRKAGAKYVLTTAVSIAAVVVYLGLATLLNLSIPFLHSNAPREFRSKAGRFTVTTPATLKKETTPASEKTGGIELHTFTGELAGVTYYVSYSDLPNQIIQQREPAELLTATQNGAVSSMKGQLITEVPINLDGNPGREFEFLLTDEKGQSWNVKERMFLVGSRFYQVMVIAPQGTSSNATMERFMTSFRPTGIAEGEP